MATTTKHTHDELDEMFDGIPRAPWKVTQIDERKNSAYVWTDRGYPKGVCVAEVHAQFIGQLPKIATAVAAVPDMLDALRLVQKAIREAGLLDVKKHFDLCVADAAVGKAIHKAEEGTC